MSKYLINVEIDDEIESTAGFNRLAIEIIEEYLENAAGVVKCEVTPYLNMNDVPDARYYPIEDVTNCLYQKDLKHFFQELGFDIQ